MDKTNYLVIGGATAAGAATGAAIGVSKGKKLVAQIDENVLKAVKSQTKDEYVNSRVEANIEKVHQLKKSKWESQFAKIREKAALDYDNVAAIAKKAKNAKFKFAAIVGAIGLALGSVFALVNSKNA